MLAPDAARRRRCRSSSRASTSRSFAEAPTAGESGERFSRMGTVGAGFFVGGGWFPVLRLDWLKRTDLKRIEAPTYTQFTIGYCSRNAGHGSAARIDAHVERARRSPPCGCRSRLSSRSE